MQVSTPFHILPAPGSMRLAPERVRPAVDTSTAPWPAPVASTVKRSNAWPAPACYRSTWPPPTLSAAYVETVTVNRRRRRPWYRKIDVRTVVGTIGASAAALAIVVALIAQL